MNQPISPKLGTGSYSPGCPRQDRVDLIEVVRRSEVQKILSAWQFGAAEFKKFIAEETDKWRTVVVEKKITGD